jgi:hypothetical protein
MMIGRMRSAPDVFAVFALGKLSAVTSGFDEDAATVSCGGCPAEDDRDLLIWLPVTVRTESDMASWSSVGSTASAPTSKSSGTSVGVVAFNAIGVASLISAIADKGSEAKDRGDRTDDEDERSELDDVDGGDCTGVDPARVGREESAVSGSEVGIGGGLYGSPSGRS